VPIGALRNKKKGCSKAALRVALCFLAIEHVHRDFKAKAHIGVFGFGPHGKAPLREIIHFYRASRPFITTMERILGQPVRHPHKKTLKSDS
jgi:hypothetical protein